MKKKILVVDDETGVRQSLKSLLEARGHEVYLASNSSTALDIYRRTHPDVVITDFQLGKDNGSLLAQEIRSYETSVGIKSQIFLISGDEVNWHSLPVDRFYRKPIDDAKLMDAIDGDKK